MSLHLLSTHGGFFGGRVFEFGALESLSSSLYVVLPEAHGCTWYPCCTLQSDFGAHGLAARANSIKRQVKTIVDQTVDMKLVCSNDFCESSDRMKNSHLALDHLTVNRI